MLLGDAALGGTGGCNETVTVAAGRREPPAGAASLNPAHRLLLSLE